MEEQSIQARLQNPALADFEVDEHGNLVSIVGIPLVLLAGEGYFDVRLNLAIRDPVDLAKKKLGKAIADCVLEACEAGCPSTYTTPEAMRHSQTIPSVAESLNVILGDDFPGTTPRMFESAIKRSLGVDNQVAPSQEAVQAKLRHFHDSSLELREFQDTAAIDNESIGDAPGDS